MERQDTNKKIFRIQLLAVLVGVVLLAAKLWAYLLTQSNTILTDALESIINVMAGVFALYSLFLSSKPRDSDHPYGHGKVEFISAGFEGVLITVAGGAIIVKSVIAFFTPHQLTHLDLGLAIIIVSGFVNFLTGYYLKKTGEQEGSLILKADGEHLLSDAYSSFGILAGMGLIMLTGWNFLDNAMAIVFGLLIIFTGIKLVRKSIAGIMDEADDAIIDEIIALLTSHRKDEWIDIHNLRVIQFGSKLHIDCHVTLPWYFTLEQAHQEIDHISALIYKQRAAQVEFSIHGDPCVKASCSICSISNCPVRVQPFQKKIIWNRQNTVDNYKHQLLQ